MIGDALGDALTRADILGCIRCVVAFAPLLLAPGYCFAWALNLLGFRKRSLGERLAWGTAVSFGVVPIVAVEVAKRGSLSAVCWLAGLCAVGLLAILAREIWEQPPRLRSRRVWFCVGVAAVWGLFAVLELVDVGVGNHFYLSVTVFDHSLRAAFVDAVTRTGVPPANPLFWPGHAVPMRYYYFWYVLTAAAARIAGATAQQAIIASAVWAGFGLAAVIALYCRHFLAGDPTGGNLFGPRGRGWPRLALALALLAVTGLDILPALVKAAIRFPTDPDMEWWSSDQVTSWIDSLIWVPHHIAGLVCCLFGFLLVWLSKGLSVYQRCLCGLLAGISFASAFGLSIWIPAAFAMALLAWMVWVMLWERESRARVPVLLGAGLIAVLALLPFLKELHAAPKQAEATVAAAGMQNAAAPVTAASTARDASHLLRFGVRRIIDPDGLLALPSVAAFAQSHPRLGGPIAGLVFRLFLLLPGYFVELGFFGLILIVALGGLRGSRLDESTRASIFLTVVSLLITTFVRSTVIENNDFGYRSVLIAQFFLLLLAVRWCEGAFGEGKPWLRRTMQTMLWIGLAGTAYQAAVLRFYLPVEDKLGSPDASGLAERAMALRVGFDALDRSIPRDAVIQYNVAQPSDYFRFAELLGARRQLASAMPKCGVPFGGDPAQCADVERGVSGLFSLRAGPRGGPVALSPAEARGECGRLGVDYLVATRWDAVWADRLGWVWTLPAAVDTGDMRVLGCRGE